MSILATPLPDWLAYRAATMPDRTALVSGGHTWTFSQLDADATRTARQLATFGIRAGDRVATVLHNGAGPALLAHAALRLGVVLVPLNVRLSEAELAWQLDDAAARLLVVEGRTALAIDAARRERSNLGIVSLDASGAAIVGGSTLEQRQEADVALRLVHDASDVLALIYTSGTTGQPKGAMLTVGNQWWSAIGSALNLGTHNDDRWLACLPLFHVGGLSIVFRTAIYGTTAVVHDGFDADAVNHAIEHEQVTMISVVAVMLQRMLDARGDRPYPASLRCVLLGGGPAPRALLERCAALHVPVVQTYGLTETSSQVVTLPPEDALRKLGSAGRPLYPNELRILRDDHSVADPRETGEIVVRGPVVMAGYASRADATALALVDGWLHTGDVGSVDEEGFLYVHDRRDDLIVTGGENVYPAEIEAALLAHPLVAETGVIGVPDATWGQRVVAVVRLRAPSTADDSAVRELLSAHCRTRLGGYKVPSEIRLVTEPLPRTASGKLRRTALRDAAADH